MYPRRVNTLPIFVISMRSERRKELISDLREINIGNVEVFQGVLGTKVADNEEVFNKKVFNYLHRRNPLEGEIGCALSHFLIYKEVVHRNTPWTLILEDDSRLNFNYVEELTSLYDDLQSIDWCNEIPIIIHLKQENRPLIAQKISIGGQDVFRCLTLMSETNAYLINFKAAQIALKHGLPLHDLADWPRWMSDVNLLTLPYDIFKVDRTLPSEIGSREASESTSKDSYFKVTREKFISAIKVLTYIEAYQYKKKTGLDSYFYWMIRQRIIRIVARAFGRPYSPGSRVVLIKWFPLNIPSTEEQRIK